MRLFRIILSAVLSILLSLLSLLSVSLFIMTSVRFRLGPYSDEIISSKYRFYSVISSSMYPALKLGDLIVVRICEPKDVQIGDIITVDLAPDGILSMLTHRLIDTLSEFGSVQGLWLVTKGDANIATDIPIPADQLIGKVVCRVPIVGRLLVSRSEAILALFIALISWGMVLFVLIRLMIRWQRNKRKATKALPDTLPI